MVTHSDHEYEINPNKAAKSDTWCYFHNIKRSKSDKFMCKSEAVSTLCRQSKITVELQILQMSATKRKR